MSAVGIVFGSLAIILVIAALVILVRRVSASPTRQYRRQLKDIRRIRKGIRRGDPSWTTIEMNSDAYHGRN